METSHAQKCMLEDEKIFRLLSFIGKRLCSPPKREKLEACTDVHWDNAITHAKTMFNQASLSLTADEKYKTFYQLQSYHKFKKIAKKFGMWWELRDHLASCPAIQTQPAYHKTTNVLIPGCNVMKEKKRSHLFSQSCTASLDMRATQSLTAFMVWTFNFR